MTTTTVLTTLVLSAVGLIAVQGAVDLPMKELLSLGSAGVALVMCVLFLREQREMRKEHAGSVEVFTNTVKEIDAAHRTSGERREAALLQMTLEVHKSAR